MKREQLKVKIMELQAAAFKKLVTLSHAIEDEKFIVAELKKESERIHQFIEKNDEGD